MTGWLAIMSDGTTYTPKELFASMTDAQRIEFVAALIEMMKPEFKDSVLKELEPKLGATGKFPDGKMDPTDEGELKLMISHSADNKIIRLDFGKPTAWIGLPKEHAVQLAMLLLQHAGARFEQVHDETLGDA